MKYFFAVIAFFLLLGSVSTFGQYIYPTDPVTGTADYSRPPIGYIHPQPTYQSPRPYSSNINELISTGGGYQPPAFNFGAAQEKAQRLRALELQNQLLEQELRRRQR